MPLNGFISGILVCLYPRFIILITYEGTDEILSHDKDPLRS